jgi:hypothetical protein
VVGAGIGYRPDEVEAEVVVATEVLVSENADASADGPPDLNASAEAPPDLNASAEAPPDLDASADGLPDLDASADALAPKTTSTRRIGRVLRTRLTRTPRRCTDG